MVRGQMICLGSCLDYQSAARSSAFGTHHDRHLFTELARETRQTEQGVRAICLRHQAQIIDDRLRSRTDDAIELMALKDEVAHALVEATVG
jgi:AAA+ superfamily predicted ATPase